MEWTAFNAHVADYLKHGRIQKIDGANPSGSEQALTEVVARSLRDLFQRSFPDTPQGDLPYHVVYRKGSTPEDRASWNLVQKHKWIEVHGLDFVPDVVVFRHLNRCAGELIAPAESSH